MTGEGFAFDNEGPRHEVLLQPVRIAERLVTNARMARVHGGRRLRRRRRSGCRTAGRRSQARRLGRARATGARSTAPGSQMTLGGLRAGRSRRAGLPRQLLRGRRLRALGRQAPADRGRMGGRGARRALLADAFGIVWQWTRSAYAPYPGYRAGRRRARRVQRQVHGRPDGAARLLARDARRAMRATSYRNFFYPPPALAVHGPAARRLRLSDLRRRPREQLRMMALAHAIRVASAREAGSAFAADLLAGLAATPKRLPPKYFYDAEGSRLFERITELPEYYPTRTELRHPAATMRARSPRSSRRARRSSSSAAAPATKVRILLDAAAARSRPTCRSTSRPSSWTRRRRGCGASSRPEVAAGGGRLHPAVRAAAAASAAGRAPASSRARPSATSSRTRPTAFLRHAARMLGSGAALMVGVDLREGRRRAGRRLRRRRRRHGRLQSQPAGASNRELGADFDLDAFAHRAFYNRRRAASRCISSAARRQTVRVLGRAFAFAAGETIHTENSYKYTLDGFRALAARAGWRAEAAWTDADELFSVHALRAKGVTLQ